MESTGQPVARRENLSEQFVTFIGDVHGCFQTLLGLLNRLPPRENNRIIFLGDLINKGPDSYKVFHFVKDERYDCVIGNHEYFCINRNKSAKRNWSAQGGKQTEHSIAKALNTRDPKEIQWALTEMAYYFQQLPKSLLYLRPDNTQILATHAGVSSFSYYKNQENLDRALHFKQGNRLDIIFNKLGLARIPGTIQIIGHRPTANAPKNIFGNIYLDSGCVYKKAGMGYLSALTYDLHDVEMAPKHFFQRRLDPVGH